MKKRIISFVMAAILLLTMLPMTALAENGPSQAHWQEGDSEVYMAFLSLYNTRTEETYSFLENNRVNADAYPGVTYERSTNELKFDSVADADSGKLVLRANMMGDDFKIRIDGRISLAKIDVWGDWYDGNLTVAGNGELTVNAEKAYDAAINMYAEHTPAKLTFGKDVKATLFSKNNVAVQTICSVNPDAAQAYVFENGQSATVAKRNWSYNEPVYIPGIRMEDAEDDVWAGYRVTSASDPDGFYAVNEGWRGDDTANTLYWVQKYQYVARYNAYIEDRNFFKDNPKVTQDGSLEYTEAEWNAQTDFTYQTVPSGEPANIGYYNPDEPEGENAYTLIQVRSASDPEGSYGAQEYSAYNSNDELIETGYYIYRLVNAPNSSRLIKDDAFAELQIPEDELEANGWSFVPGYDRVEFKWTGRLIDSVYPLAKDGSGNKYVKGYDNAVYRYAEGSGINIGSTFYYYFEEAPEVDADSLTVVTELVEADGLYDYAIAENPFEYNTEAPEHTHSYGKGVVTQKAAFGRNGIITYTCSCGDKKYGTIPMLKTAVLSASNFTYDGKRKTPGVTVKDSAGRVLSRSYYDVKYSSNNYAIGTATVTLTFKGNYSGTRVLKFNIIPRGTAISKLKSGKRTLTVNWKKQAAQTNGYQIQYSTDKTFRTGVKTVNIFKVKTVKKAFKKLQSKKVYYVRVRTFKKVGATYYYSTWSPTRYVKVK